jgi:hypothetical protein
MSYMPKCDTSRIVVREVCQRASQIGRRPVGSIWFIGLTCLALIPIAGGKASGDVGSCMPDPLVTVPVDCRWCNVVPDTWECNDGQNDSPSTDCESSWFCRSGCYERHLLGPTGFDPYKLHINPSGAWVLPDFPPISQDPGLGTSPLLTAEVQHFSGPRPFAERPLHQGLIDVLTGRPLWRETDFELPFGGATFRHVRTHNGEDRFNSTAQSYSPNTSGFDRGRCRVVTVL